MSRLAAAARRQLGESAFALPTSLIVSPALRAKVRRGGFAGAYPMDTRRRGANARGRAIQMLNRGFLSLSEAQNIFDRTAQRWGFRPAAIERVSRGRYRAVRTDARALAGAANRMAGRGARDAEGAYSYRRYDGRVVDLSNTIGEWSEEKVAAMARAEGRDHALITAVLALRGAGFTPGEIQEKVRAILGVEPLACAVRTR